MNKRQRQLLEAAEELVDAGFQLVPIGSNKVPALAKGEYAAAAPAALTKKTLDLIETEKVTGFRIELGSRGAIAQDDGTVLVPLAIEREGHVSKAYRSRFVDALVRLGVMDTVWSRLNDEETGFVQETGSGGRRWFFHLALDTIADLNDALSRVASRVSMEGEETAAELLYGHAIAAPSYGRTHPSGDPYTFYSECDPLQMPVLTVDELALLGAVLAETSDAEPVVAGSTIVKLPGRLSQRARDVLRLYNAAASDEQACDLLLSAGWTLHSGEPGLTDEVFFSRPNAKHGNVDAKVGGGAQEGGVYVYSTSDPVLTKGYHPPFALRARLLHEASADAAADALVTEGVVDLPVNATGIIRAKNVQEIELHTMPSVEAQQTMVDALASAENPRDSETPLVLVKADSLGTPQFLLTPIPGAAPTRWTQPRDLGALLLSVVQPCAIKRDDDGVPTGISYKHAVDSKLVDGVYKHLMNTPGALPAARIIASEPVLVKTRDGLVIEGTSGYHPETGVLLNIPHADRGFWAEGYRVDSTPTRQQAQAAADYLLAELFADFPFATEGDRARALAHLLTLTARTALPTVPAWLIDAPDRGTGKSKLADVCRLVASGSTSTTPVFPYARDDEENRKAVVGAVQSGRTNLYIDEMPRGGEITSKLLTEVVTSLPGTMSLRILGGNQMLPIEGLTLTYAGNNVAVGGDFNRRTFPIRLEWTGGIAAHERGGFRHADLLGWAADNRPTLLAACHTILLHGAQNPGSAPDVGSFEKWSALILGSLAHITMGDQTAADLVMAGRTEWTESNDVLGSEWGDFYEWWAETAPGALDIKGLRVKLDAARKAGVQVELPPDIYANPGEGDMTINRRWALAFKGMRGTAVPHNGANYRLVVEDRGKKAARYRLDVLTRSDATPAHAAPARTSAPSDFMPDAPEQRERAVVSVGAAPTDLEF